MPPLRGQTAHSLRHGTRAPLADLAPKIATSLSVIEQEVMELCVLYGLPGVGKLTVARELSRLRLEYKLFHIHMLADMLEPLFGFGSQGFVELRDRIWPMVIERAVGDGLPGLIATIVFERSVPEAMVPNVRDRVVEAGGAVRFVQLVCEKAENERRLASPARTRHPVELFNDILAAGQFTTPADLGDTLTLDTTRLSAAQAADSIAGHWA